MISSIRKKLEFKSGAQTILTRKNKGVMKNYLRNYKEIYNFDLKPQFKAVRLGSWQNQFTHTVQRLLRRPRKLLSTIYEEIIT